MRSRKTGKDKKKSSQKKGGRKVKGVMTATATVDITKSGDAQLGDILQSPPSILLKPLISCNGVILPAEHKLARHVSPWHLEEDDRDYPWSADSDADHHRSLIVSRHW